jgi:hypothetical protein
VPTTKPINPGWALPKGIDPECVDLCRALNALPGIATNESCCGHGESPFRIWFEPANKRALADLCYWTDGCHCGVYGWKVIVYTDCSAWPLRYFLEGPIGAFDEANKMAASIQAGLRR